MLAIPVFTQNRISPTSNMVKKNKKQQHTLKFLYMTSSGKVVRAIIKNKWFSSLAGVYADSRISKREIEPFVCKYDINMHEAQESYYRTFNDFFSRKLKTSARPIELNPKTVVSPADGQILVIENIQAVTPFPIKEICCNLEKLLGSKKIAESFIGGTLVIVRLAPWDYHRFHFPLDGIPEVPLVIHGKYESVNPIAYYANIQPLTENERHVILFNTEQCSRMAIIPVGALCVGRLIETYQPHVVHNKGDETGYFEFGGSTVVLLFEKDTVKINENILINSRKAQETVVKMGQVIGEICLAAA